MKTLFALLFAVGCASSPTTHRDYELQGDVCAVYNDAQSCDAHGPCHWYDLGIPCQVGQPCVSGVCSSPGGGGGGGGSGSSGSGGGGGSASAGCACYSGGVCFEQIGGPAQQGSGGPTIQCAIDATTCADITGQGTCAADPNVTNLCLCDNGIR